MRIDVRGVNVEVTEELREAVTQRFARVGNQVSELATLEVEIADVRTPTDPVTAEATLTLKGTTLRAKSASKDAKHAINLVSDDLARQVKRHRDKRRARRESRAVAEQAFEDGGLLEFPAEEPSSSR